MKALLVLVAGALFGVGLAVSGMTNPAKVIGFLDLAGKWDPSLALVMVGAIGSFAALNQLITRRAKPVWGERFPGKPDQKITPRVLIGAALFGTGWGLAGFCPGPAITNLGGLRVEALILVPAMLVGMIVAQRVFGMDAPPKPPEA